MQKLVGACAALAVAISLSPLTLNSVRAQSAPSAVVPACEAPAELTKLDQPISRFALSLMMGEPVVIVAIGSSSTAGAGASSPAMSYPSRLQNDLRARFPGVPITVINQGVNGEDARQMLDRFDAVIAEQPDLVLWQVGTNAVLRDHSLEGEAPLIREGIARLRAAHTDVILIDAQYAPKVLVKPDANGMVELIRTSARRAGVGVFHRWDIMRKWHIVDGVPFDKVLAPDGLHMNDWSYGCLAKLLAISIADAARGPSVARIPRR
jgi:lysophospholipase L1-like esterase